jgi:hypothetical protein
VKNAITDFIRQHAKPSNAGKEKQYGWQTYSDLYLKIGAILRPNTDTEDLQKLVKEDFERDCMEVQPEVESSDEENKEDEYAERKNDSDEEEEEKPKEEEAPAIAQKAPDYLTEVKLFDSLFELADTWCPDIDPIQYKQFFDTLTKKIKLPGQGNPSAYDAMP